jgi:hypothetical protein
MRLAIESPTQAPKREAAESARQASIELEQAVQLDPDNAAAHYRLAQAYRRTNQTATSIAPVMPFDLYRAIFRFVEDRATSAGSRIIVRGVIQVFAFTSFRSSSPAYFPISALC